MRCPTVPPRSQSATVPERRPSASHRGSGFWAALSVSLILGMILLTGCHQDDGSDRIPLDSQGGLEEAVEDLPEEIQQQLDSANAAYRGQDYEAALQHYGEVTRLVPGLAAGWYGVGMTHMALGNGESADSAMMRVHQLAPEVPLAHPQTEAPANPHPRSGTDTEGGPSR
jgi:tetratricopeptide (TPR) repeat protein